jgi:hypothetical protein
VRALDGGLCVAAFVGGGVRGRFGRPAGLSGGDCGGGGGRGVDRMGGVAPACAVGALFCGVTGWPRFAAFPVVFVCGLLFSSVLFANHALLFAAPLGVYWWVVEGPCACFEAFRRWRAGRREKNLAVTK